MIEAISSLFEGMPREGVIALLVLVSLQLASQVAAFIDLARRREVYGGRKWAWAAGILFGNLLGAVLYFAVGRRSEGSGPGSDSGAGSVSVAATDALDRLYGAKLEGAR